MKTGLFIVALSLASCATLSSRVGTALDTLTAASVVSDNAIDQIAANPDLSLAQLKQLLAAKKMLLAATETLLIAYQLHDAGKVDEAKMLIPCVVQEFQNILTVTHSMGMKVPSVLTRGVQIAEDVGGTTCGKQ